MPRLRGNGRQGFNQKRTELAGSTQSPGYFCGSGCQLHSFGMFPQHKGFQAKTVEIFRPIFVAPWFFEASFRGATIKDSSPWRRLIAGRHHVPKTTWHSLQLIWLLFFIESVEHRFSAAKYVLPCFEYGRRHSKAWFSARGSVLATIRAQRCGKGYGMPPIMRYLLGVLPRTVPYWPPTVHILLMKHPVPDRKRGLHINTSRSGIRGSGTGA